MASIEPIIFENLQVISVPIASVKLDILRSFYIRLNFVNIRKTLLGFGESEENCL